MPYANMPWVHSGKVRTPEGARITMDTTAWFTWLGTISSFCYSSPAHIHRLTVRRERRGRHSYWYAYSKIDAKLHNVYVGKTAQLTHARLEQVSRQLLLKARKEVPQTD